MTTLELIDSENIEGFALDSQAFAQTMEQQQSLCEAGQLEKWRMDLGEIHNLMRMVAVQCKVWQILERNLR
jgi:hypothetical protein